MNGDAVRAFLGELIDDAGLFPPARLPMAEAVLAHQSAAAGDAFWIAGRFVVPASRLEELARSLDDTPVALEAAVVVDGPVAGEAAFLAIARCVASLAQRVRVEALELPLARIPGATDDDRCATLASALASAGLEPPTETYLEVLLGEDGGEEALLALHRARERGLDLRAKVRCGGLEPAAIPSTGSLSRFVWTANRLGVPFKATAGLHAPLRHADPRLGADVHGFLNVIGGAVLARARGLDRATLATLLDERETTAFTLDARRFAWRGIGADPSEIAEARATFVHSYGSCSFDEPVDALRALGVLPDASVTG